jgi:hypothetical protein
MQFNWFKRGFATQMAIMVACEMAFILFGRCRRTTQTRASTDLDIQVTTKGSSLAS